MNIFLPDMSSSYFTTLLRRILRQPIREIMVQDESRFLFKFYVRAARNNRSTPLLNRIQCYEIATLMLNNLDQRSQLVNSLLMLIDDMLWDAVFRNLKITNGTREDYRRSLLDLQMDIINEISRDLAYAAFRREVERILLDQ